MQIYVTVGWANTVTLDVDEARLKDEAYLNECRKQAVKQAGDNINWKDGMITDCPELPNLCE